MAHNFFQWEVKWPLGFLVVLLSVLFCMGGPDWGKRLPTEWGESTNNVRAGIAILYRDQVFGTPPICEFHLQSVSSNTFGLRLPKLDKRYQMELHGPDGALVPLKRSAQISTFTKESPGTYRPNQDYGIETFSIPDVFAVRTNGLHTLVVSVWVSTNYLVTRKTQTHYFLTPPVTNVFDVPANSIKR